MIIGEAYAVPDWAYDGCAVAVVAVLDKDRRPCDQDDACFVMVTIKHQDGREAVVLGMKTADQVPDAVKHARQVALAFNEVIRHHCLARGRVPEVVQKALHNLQTEIEQGLPA